MIESPLEIDFERTWTIVKCKKEILQQLSCCENKNHENYRLRRTNFWGEPDQVFENENSTVSKENIVEGDLLWIEEGSLPPKGLITLSLQLYYVRPTDDPLLCSPNIAYHLALKESKLMEVFSDLFEFDIQNSITVQELKQRLFQHPVFEKVPSLEWLRIWHKDRLLKKETWSLKKNYITTSTSLTVQIAPPFNPVYPPGTETPPPSSSEGGGILLYILKRDCTQRTFRDTKELFYVGDLYNLPNLYSVVSSLFNIPTEHIKLYKFIPFNRTWKPLECKETTSTSTTTTNGPSTEEPPQTKVKKPKSKNIFFKDGDIIAFKDEREDEENEDDFVAEASIYVKKKRSDNQDSILFTADSKKKKQYERREEVPLTIFVDEDD
jgi:hypothetical protein